MIKIILLLCLYLGATLSAQEKQILPKFAFQNVDGMVVSSKEFEGKALIIDFWATWCLSCKKVIPVLNELQKKYENKAFATIGINTEKKRRNKVVSYMIKNNIEYPTLFAGQGSRLAEDLEVFSLPSIFLFNGKGELVLKVEGFEEDDKKKLLGAVKKLMR
ncbi:MAG: TlpA family protein disulfide reductase [Fibrobacterales bacterium]